MNETFTPATHREVREELMKMQKCGGAMITPFMLYRVMLLFFSKEEQVLEKFKTRARFYTYTLCALCNEYFLIYCCDKHPKTEFFIPEKRWEKYFITAETREQAIDFLQKHNIIACGEITLPSENKTVRTYKINFEMLTVLRKAAEDIYEAERAQKNPF